jgi:hypothetical protein
LEKMRRAVAGLTADLVQATTEAEAKQQAETLAATLLTPRHDQGVRPAGKSDSGTAVPGYNRPAYALRLGAAASHVQH